jgi:site-specific recombinase XerD
MMDTDDCRALEQVALEDFAASQRARNLSPQTIRTYRSILNTFAATVPLLEATARDARMFMGRDGVTPGTRRVNRAVLIAFYRFAVDEGYCAINPAERLEPVRAPRNEPRPFTPQQIDAMLNSGAYRRTRAMILLGYYQGFRVSQIAAVEGRHIDLRSGTIVTTGKGSKTRTLPLHPVIEELAASMPEGFWFPARRGRPGHISGNAVTGLIGKAIRRAGITDPRLTAHSLRHSFGTDLVEQGVDIRVVSELMMHESLATTQIYTRVSDRLKREGIVMLPPRPIPDRSFRRAA